MFNKKNVTAVATLLLVAACGGGGAKHHTEDSTLVSGRVVKGVLSGADVRAYAIGEQGPGETALAMATTNEEGHYQLTLPADHNAPLLIEVTTNSQTRMTCDVAAGCYDVATGENAALGTWIGLDEDFRLTSLLPNPVAGKDNVAQVNLFTDAARELLQNRVEAGNGKYSVEEMIQVNAEMTDLLRDHKILAVGQTVLRTEAVDVADAEEVKKAENGESEQSAHLGFFLAALARTAQEDYAGDVMAMQKAFKQVYLENDGELPLLASEGGASPISMQGLMTGLVSEVEAFEESEEGVPLGGVKAQIKNQLADLAKKSGGKDEDDITDSDPPPVPESDLEEGKDIVKAFRSLGHALDENLRDVSKAITGEDESEIELSTEQVKPLVDLAREFYPHMAQIILAAISMVEDDSAREYDLAVDEKNFLPDDVVVTGVVKRSQHWYGSPRLVLEDGYIEGLGSVTFNATFRSSYYCCTVYVDLDMSLRGGKGEMVFRDTLTVNRSYSWRHRMNVPSTVYADTASVRLRTFDEDGAETFSISGNTTFGLRWSSQDMSRLPFISYVTLEGSYYDWQADVSYLQVRVSYSNRGWTYWQPADPVEWAQEHAKYFALSVEVEARVKVPQSGRYDWLNYHDAAITAILQVNRNEVTRVLAIEYDNEAFGLWRTHTEDGYYSRFYNQAGNFMELLISEDGKDVSGVININGQDIAKISGKLAKTLIRYTDGTFESF